MLMSRTRAILIAVIYGVRDGKIKPSTAEDFMLSTGSISTTGNALYRAYMKDVRDLLDSVANETDSTIQTTIIANWITEVTGVKVDPADLGVAQAAAASLRYTTGATTMEKGGIGKFRGMLEKALFNAVAGYNYAGDELKAFNQARAKCMKCVKYVEKLKVQEKAAFMSGVTNYSEIEKRLEDECAKLLCLEAEYKKAEKVLDESIGENALAYFTMGDMRWQNPRDIAQTMIDCALKKAKAVGKAA